jgi:hypothetical protein
MRNEAELATMQPWDRHIPKVSRGRRWVLRYRAGERSVTRPARISRQHEDHRFIRNRRLEPLAQFWHPNTWPETGRNAPARTRRPAPRSGQVCRPAVPSMRSSACAPDRSSRPGGVPSSTGPERTVSGPARRARRGGRPRRGAGNKTFDSGARCFLARYPDPQVWAELPLGARLTGTRPHLQPVLNLYLRPASRSASPPSASGNCILEAVSVMG